MNPIRPFQFVTSDELNSRLRMPRPTTILVVDDNPDTTAMLVRLLGGEGYVVRSAASGEGALAAIAAEPPDLILLEIHLPGIDGFEVCQRLKAETPDLNTPIVFISAGANSEERARAFRVGAADFVSKPMQADELRASVHTQLGLRRVSVDSERRSARLQSSNDRLQEEVAEHEPAAGQLRRLARVVEQAPVSVAITDLAGTLTYVNPTFSQVTGYGEEEVLGQNPRILQSGLTPPGLFLEMWRTLTAGQVWRGELQNRRKTGEVYSALAVIAPVFGPDGRSTNYVSIEEDVTERNRAERSVQTSLQEKEALLKEVHHRVKNNLQVISSLLRLEAGRSAEPGTRTVLGEMQGRILSMALLHETLYRSGEFRRVDLANYLKELAQRLIRAQTHSFGAVRLEMEMVPVHVGIDQAIPCGLIVNELLTNSLKHGFGEEQAGELRLVVHPEPEGHVRVEVSDNGRGLPQDFDARRSGSLGLQLVSDLTRQIGGRLEIGPGRLGRFAVTFPAAGSHPTGPTPRPQPGAPR